LQEKIFFYDRLHILLVHQCVQVWIHEDSKWAVNATKLYYWIEQRAVILVKMAAEKIFSLSLSTHPAWLSLQVKKNPPDSIWGVDATKFYDWN
jgi:hypothetical protein